MPRSYLIEDEGDHIEFSLLEDGAQVGGGLIDLEPLGVDAALQVAYVVCQGFLQAGGGWGGVRPI